MEIGIVKKIDIEQEMQQSYLDYAMSVIVARALPDARDGLKPVQRRILYAMYDMGLRINSDYKKSARIVGEVLGKYHPHGDMAVYEAMARMAQEFSMRYPLVDGQGNFGSIDGDPPAAMRYTEARLLPIAETILFQIDQDTVDFVPNFDGTIKEPVVLPSAIPNLLINGASGIAVGMATNIPPHNLGEVVDAMCLLLGKWEKLDDISVEDLMKIIHGPDFPTGGLIIQEGGQNDLLTTYGSGRGKVIIRGRVQYEELERGKDGIIITELPYMTNKSALIERIAELVREGVIKGIVDLRDESDRQGMRIVIEVGRAADKEEVLRELYKRTPLQSTFGISMLALVNDEPHYLTIKQTLRIFLEHRLVVVKRRVEHDLEKARQREHILVGLRIAIVNIDEIISIIRNASDTEQAKNRLKNTFKLSDVQAQSILDMPLKRLASLERKKLEIEYKEVVKYIKELEILLKSPKKIRDVVNNDLLDLKNKFADRRRTQIINLLEGQNAKSLLTIKELTPAQNTWIVISSDNIISRSATDNLPRISGKNYPKWLLRTNTHHNLYVTFTDGKSIAVSVESLPVADSFSEGQSISKISSMDHAKEISGVFSIPINKDEKSGSYVVTISSCGLIKKTDVNDLPGASTQSFILAKINKEDNLVDVLLTKGNSDIFLLTANGIVIRFSETEVRSMGLVAAGVNGIKLGKADYIIGGLASLPEGQLLLLSLSGRSWRISGDEIPIQGRYGQGVIACKIQKEDYLSGFIYGKNNKTGLVIFKKAASKLVRVDIVPIKKRGSPGQTAYELKASDEISSVVQINDGLVFWEKPNKSKKPLKR
jgi:DNA gyrase subunit A